MRSKQSPRSLSSSPVVPLNVHAGCGHGNQPIGQAVTAGAGPAMGEWIVVLLSNMSAVHLKLFLMCSYCAINHFNMFKLTPYSIKPLFSKITSLQLKTVSYNSTVRLWFAFGAL